MGTSHSLVDEGTSRESLYVALTRGAGGNWAYVITHGHAAGFIPEEESPPPGRAGPHAAAHRLEQTATQAIAAELERREHLAVLEPVWAGVKDRDAELRYGRALLRRPRTGGVPHASPARRRTAA